MSWIKIEVQKGNPKKTAKSSVEPIDYEKIREITREVVKAEIKEQQNNQPTQLTKEDIQEAVCNGILQAGEKKDEIARKKIRGTKLSVWSIISIIFFGMVATFFAVLSLVMFFNEELEVMERITDGAKLALIALTYVFVIIAEYAVGKNKNQAFGFNMITVLLTMITLVVTIIQ